MKLSQFLFSWRFKSLLCWRLVLVRRPRKVEILLSSICTSRPVCTSKTPPLPPGSKTARCILDNRSHWFGTVLPFGMVNGGVFPTPKVSATVSWFGLGSQKLQLWPCLSDGNGCWLSHGREVWVFGDSFNTTSSITYNLRQNCWHKPPFPRTMLIWSRVLSSLSSKFFRWIWKTFVATFFGGKGCNWHFIS